MDSITQGLLGAVTAQLGFRQRIGRDATWVAAAAAVVPDLDMFLGPVLSLFGVDRGRTVGHTLHRGYTHALPVAPILSLLIAVLWWWIRRRHAKTSDGAVGGRPPSFGLLYACVFAAVVTHSLLDWCTSWGTQLLLPFTNTRYALDVIGIVDIIYTPILILTLIGCAIAARHSRRHAMRSMLLAGWAGFLLATGYLFAGWVLHNGAVGKARQQLAGEPITRITRIKAYPMVGTIFLWRVVAETPDRWVAMRVHYFAPPGRPYRTEEAPKQHNQWIDRAREVPEVKGFDWFDMGMTRASYERRGDGLHVVAFHDMRYGTGTESTESGRTLRVTFDGAGRLLGLSSAHHHAGGRRGSFARRAWSDIWNP
jgi:inner membrane protein